MADDQSIFDGDKPPKEVYVCPAVRSPTLAQVTAICQELGIQLEEDELKTYHTFIKGNIDMINSIEHLVEPKLPTKYPRLPGYRPEQADNPYNAWYWKCDIQGAATGPLSGKRVAIKDNVAVAGVPMMNGCHALEGYMPDFDATVVTRILDAGATIIGKTVCENLCISGGSSTAAKGPVRNPHDTQRSAGGSSSGSAVVVSVGDADLAIGGDQGGSVRLPACWTGVVGLKPTFGLVPYTGAMSLEMALDHLGPMARTVRDCALFLQAIAGYDGGRDPRQNSDIAVPEYTRELDKASIDGLKIGVLTEGFTVNGTDSAVSNLLKETINKLQDEGGIVRDVSVPLHTHSFAIWGSVWEGSYENMVRLGGMGTGHTGYYPSSFGIASGKMFPSRVNDLATPTKALLIQGLYLSKVYKKQVYAKGRNLVFSLRQAYDRALEEVDVLVMPTIPFTASELIFKEESFTDSLTKCVDMLANTTAFNLTGHPAISVNAGFLRGLPVGLMLVGRHFDECTLFKVAQAVERVRDAAAN